MSHANIWKYLRDFSPNSLSDNLLIIFTRDIPLQNQRTFSDGTNDLRTLAARQESDVLIKKTNCYRSKKEEEIIQPIEDKRLTMQKFKIGTFYF